VAGAVSRHRDRQPRHEPPDETAGSLHPEISSFGLHLAAEGKAAKTITTYAEAVQWFAAGFLLPQAGRTRWEEADKQDVQRWIALLLGRIWRKPTTTALPRPPSRGRIHFDSP
jgi:hypothetical protein